MKTERGIAMSGPMVLQTLAGAKTETRRVVGSKKVNRYGKVGDWLYVREKTKLIESESDRGSLCGFASGVVPDRIRLEYLADGALSLWIDYPTRLATLAVGECIPHGCYKEAARIWLEITEIRVEQLQAITSLGRKREGCGCSREVCGCGEFANLWDNINKKRGYGWETNPLVWVIKYKVLSTTGRPELLEVKHG